MTPLHVAIHDANEALSSCELYAELLEAVEENDDALYNALLDAYIIAHNVAFSSVNTLIGVAMRHNAQEEQKE